MAETDRAAASSSTSTESLAAGLRGWLHDGARLLRVRLELLSIEARDHALGVVELLLLGLSAVILLGLGLGFLSILLTVLLWDGHRTLALTVFAVLFLTLGVGALLLAWRLWRREQKWFDASLRELRLDEERSRP